MIEGAAKFVGAKVITAIVGVTSLITLIWFWNLDPAAKDAIWGTLQHSVTWVGFAAALPWGFFFLPATVLKTESNLVSGLMLAGYMLVDILVALWLAGWHPGGTLTWAVMILGFLCAGVYNLIVSDYLAGRAEDGA